MNRNEKTETSNNIALKKSGYYKHGFGGNDGISPIRLELDSMRLAKQLYNIGLSKLTGYFTAVKRAAKLPGISMWLKTRAAKWSLAPMLPWRNARFL
jgi:hypothetical protein